MNLLEQVKGKITELHTCDAAYILAHAAWSACDFRMLPGPCVFKVSVALDGGNAELISKLQRLSLEVDFHNGDQAEMLRWLHTNGYSAYVAKKVKMTKKNLVDWA